MNLQQTPIRRLVAVPVMLYVDLPPGVNYASYGADAMNEILRGQQRSFSPDSCLLDYTINGDMQHLRVAADEYTEGDYIHAMPVSTWTEWLPNPFGAVLEAAKANGTPDDFKRVVEVMAETTRWESIDSTSFLDDLLQEIAGVTNIVVQQQDGKFRAAYDE
jgi:hypothetical protein